MTTKWNAQLKLISKTTKYSNNRVTRISTFLRLIVVSSVLMSLGACSAVAKTDTAIETTPPAKRLTVVITGANRGLGLEMAKQFHADGYHVIATARRPERAVMLGELGVQVEQLDVADAKSVAAFSDRMVGQTIDVLINNAGYLGAVPIEEQHYSIEDIQLIDDVQRVVDVNTIGPLRVTQALIKNLRAGTTRKIVNISAEAGSLGRGDWKNGPYGYQISKAALNKVTRVVAIDLADEEFIVIAITPGWTKSDMGTQLATSTAEQSIGEVKRVIEGLTPEHNGGFFFRDGSRYPW